MTPPKAHTKVEDNVMWFSHLDDALLRRQLAALRGEEHILLEVGNVVGPWQRMNAGPGGKETPGLRPLGQMKRQWNEWYNADKGMVVTVRRVAEERLT